ncbi:hypothetical protein RJ639_015634 [Escallonia herrerae]|uniref:CCHC-type domain-containing protein n=1 Tax=Escallonia herrerae TaxID=1293975 RepID=A0AA88VD54_9ASTE|nr:hypothetical protein RJ639_015634 [Escallonia herrerae]
MIVNGDGPTTGYHCHKEGHYRKDCPERKGKKKDNSKVADAGVVEDNSDGADVLSVTINSSNRWWILDTGCSYHMCPNRDLFVTYRSFDGSKVHMGNDVACKVVVIGSFQIRMHDDIVRTLTDVRHVPKLRKNLISLGSLNSNGCSYRAASRVMRIMKDALVVMKGLKQNSLYWLQCSTVTRAAAGASSSDIDSDTTELWHIPLGHMSERGMDVLSKQGLLGSKKTGKLDFYEHCVFEKQCRVKFSRAVNSTKNMVDYIHSDLWGPSTVPSRGGGRYMLTFIDDFSRKVWVYILKKKSDVFVQDVTFDESSMFSKKKELIDAGKDHGVREKVELEMRMMVLILPRRIKNLRNNSITLPETDREEKFDLLRSGVAAAAGPLLPVPLVEGFTTDGRGGSITSESVNTGLGASAGEDEYIERGNQARQGSCKVGITDVLIDLIDKLASMHYHTLIDSEADIFSLLTYKSRVQYQQYLNLRLYQDQYEQI